ncbi:MAG TPA: branched-chain amino acid ABC transporter permease, partial [Acidothermaceae bacterium]
MTTVRSDTIPNDKGWLVRRSTRASRVASVISLVAVVALFAIPEVMGANAVQQLTSLFTFLILAIMWNALAGYGGMVSVGQQAFIGFGAYTTIFLTQHGVTPYLAVVIAAFASAALAAVESLLVLSLRGGQFAVGTWVVAEVLALLVTLDHSMGGGSGISLHGLNRYSITDRRDYTYWLSLAFMVLLLGSVFLLLRRRTGAALQAIRDDEEAAASVGVRVRPLRFLLFVLAGFGCGAAGALILADTSFIQPT